VLPAAYQLPLKDRLRISSVHVIGLTTRTGEIPLKNAIEFGLCLYSVSAAARRPIIRSHELPAFLSRWPQSPV